MMSAKLTISNELYLEFYTSENNSNVVFLESTNKDTFGVLHIIREGNALEVIKFLIESFDIEPSQIGFD